MKSNTRLFTGVVLSILIPLGTPASHAASDGKTLPGATCQPQNQSQPFIYTTRGAVFNQSSVAQTFVCPIVRDLIGGDNDGINDFLMKVFDRQPNPNQNISCTLRSMRNNGTTRASSNKTTTGSNPGVMTLDFPALARSERGYYIVSCKLPGRHATGSSGILMYQMDEEK